MTFKLFVGLAAIASCLFAQKPQGPLTNQKIGDLVIAGVSATEIIRIIGSAPSVNFDLRPGSTDNLLNAGVSEDVIKAMSARESGATRSAVSSSAPAPGLSFVPSGKAAPKPRVFVEESNDSWSFTASRHFGQGSTHPQTVEVIKTFAESCPGLIVTDNPEKADFKVRFERESNKGLARRHNKFAAFNRDGDLVFADSTRALGNSVRGFCAAIQGVNSPQMQP